MNRTVISVFNYLFIIQEPILANAGSACINAKERKVRRGKKRKGIEANRVKHPTPSQVTDVLTGDEEQNRKQKRAKRKKRTRCSGHHKVDALCGFWGDSSWYRY